MQMSSIYCGDKALCDSPYEFQMFNVVLISDAEFSWLQSWDECAKWNLSLTQNSH